MEKMVNALADHLQEAYGMSSSDAKLAASLIINISIMVAQLGCSIGGMVAGFSAAASTAANAAATGAKVAADTAKVATTASDTAKTIQNLVTIANTAVGAGSLASNGVSTFLTYRSENSRADTSELEKFMTMLQQRLELLSYNGIAQKAAFYLLIQARQSGKNVIRIPGSVSSWALIMNVSRSSLHRELKKLEADGLISYAPPVIEIHDFDALQNVLSK